MLIDFKDRVKQNPQAAICFLIFATCLFVYLANQDYISSSDNFPNSLLALNWLINHTFHFDALREGFAYRSSADVPYFFVEAPNGHLTSTYPVGVAIVTFPLYLIFFLYLKLIALFQSFDPNITSNLFDITDYSFNLHRRAFEKLAASIAASLSVVIFYLATRLKFDTAIALIVTFVFAFATNTWMTSSQGLWQHGISNLIVVSLILCLFKANRTTGSSRRQLLLITGVLCGLLPGVRPTSVLFSAAAVIYSLFTYRKEAIFLLLGLPSALLSASWNFYYFGFDLKNFFVGGYSRFSKASFVQSYYVFTFQQFRQGFLGLLFSPSRGLFIYSPVILFSLLGVREFFKRKWGKDEQLVGCMAIATIAVFLQYCFFTVWAGGWCYGPRYMTDLMPVTCFFMGYFLSRQLKKFQLQPIKQSSQLNLSLIAFFICVILSTCPQVIGAFASTNWDGIPYSSVERIWKWQDSQIERHMHSLFFKATKPLERPRPYLKNLSGSIEQIKDENDQPVANPLMVRPKEELILKADVTNTGKSQWFGYQTGIMKGATGVSVQFLGQQGEALPAIPISMLYVSGMPKRGESTTAIGSVIFPDQPGEYRLAFNLGVRGLRAVNQIGEQPLFELTAIIDPNRPKAQ